MGRLLRAAWSMGRHEFMDYSWWGAAPQAVLVAACIDAFTIYLPPPGVAIGVLGFVAACMAVRSEHNWSIGEKIVWILLSFSLLIVELRSIYQDRNDYETRRMQAETEEQKARREEHESFNKLIDSGRSIFTNEQRIAKKTEGVLTGGDSYVVITASNPSGGGDTLTLIGQICPRCKTKNSIPNATVQMVQIKPANPAITLLLRQTVDPNYSQICYATVTPSEIGETEYKITILARNIPTVEYLTVRFNSEHKYWEFKYRVLREIKQAHYNFQTKLAEGQVLKTLVEEPWSSGQMTEMNERTIEKH